MKRIVLFVYVISLLAIINAEDIFYTVKEETIPTFKFSFYQEPLMPGERIRSPLRYSTLNKGVYISYYLEYPDTLGEVNSDDLFIEGSDSFDNSIRYNKDLGVMKSDVWIPTYYVSALEQDDPDLLLLYEKHLLCFDDWKYWYEPASFWFNDIVIYQYYPEIGGGSTFYITNIIDTGNNIYYGTMIPDVLENRGIRASGLENIIEQKEYAFYIYHQNNRIRIYIEGEEQPRWELMKVSREFANILQEFPNKGSWSGDKDFKQYLPSDIFQTWTVLSLTEIKQMINTLEINSFTSPTHIVSENLRLRSSQNTSSEIVTTLRKGSAVQVLETGSIQTIDGITAPWVKVLSETGYVGWCFSGYLKEL